MSHLKSNDKLCQILKKCDRDKCHELMKMLCKSTQKNDINPVEKVAKDPTKSAAENKIVLKWKMGTISELKT